MLLFRQVLPKHEIKGGVKKEKTHVFRVLNQIR